MCVWAQKIKELKYEGLCRKKLVKRRNCKYAAIVSELYFRFGKWQKEYHVGNERTELELRSGEFSGEVRIKWGS